jgi:hypothetical protein
VSTPPPIRVIGEAIRTLESAQSPIPPGDIRDGLAVLLDTIVQRHHRISATPDRVAECSCGDEWAHCEHVEHAARLARTIVSARDDERARVGNNWRV